MNEEAVNDWLSLAVALAHNPTWCVHYDRGSDCVGARVHFYCSSCVVDDRGFTGALLRLSMNRNDRTVFVGPPPSYPVGNYRTTNQCFDCGGSLSTVKTVLTTDPQQRVRHA